MRSVFPRPSRFHPNLNLDGGPVARWCWLALIVLLMTSLAMACGNEETPTPSTSASTSTSGGAQPTTATSSAAASTSTTTPTDSAGMGTGTATPATPSASASPSSSGETTRVSLYFMREDKVGTSHRDLPKTKEIGAATMRALLGGPNATEQAAGLSTAIPDGVQLRGLTISNSIATVDLSGIYESGGSQSMLGRLAQVVYTLTQFPSVDSVTFHLDGKPVDAFGGEGVALDHPVGRADFEGVTPAIFVESPAVGDSVASPAQISGTANTFEATLFVSVVDASGKQLVEKLVTATSGSGTRGTFNVSVPFQLDQSGVGEGKIVAFEKSAKDGSRIHVVEIPVQLTK